MFQKSRLKYLTYPLIGYLYINSLRNEISDLQVLPKTIEPDHFVVSETKINDNFLLFMIKKLNVPGEVLFATGSKNLGLNLLRQLAQKLKQQTNFGCVSVSICLSDQAQLAFLKDQKILLVKLVLSMISSLLWETSTSTLRNSNVQAKTNLKCLAIRLI